MRPMNCPSSCAATRSAAGPIWKPWSRAASNSATGAWWLSARHVRMDFESNTGVAQGAVLRFQGVPILAAPVLSFPLSDQRKSGWLPPNFNLDSRGGFAVSVPYYWNIAPQRDATFTPLVSSKRGVGLGSEFRYLEPGYQGSVNVDLLPNDSVAR